MASDALIAEIKALREEVAGLRQEMQSMRLLEHKPETAETPAGTPRRWWPGKTLTRCACPTGDGHAMNCVPVTGY